MPPKNQVLSSQFINPGQYTGIMPQGGGNPMADILARMFMQQQMGVQTQPIDYAGLFGAIRDNPQGDANRGYIPGVKDDKYNPFDNGFFGGPPTSSAPTGSTPATGQAMYQARQNDQRAAMAPVPAFNPAQVPTPVNNGSWIPDIFGGMSRVLNGQTMENTQEGLPGQTPYGVSHAPRQPNLSPMPAPKKKKNSPFMFGVGIGR